MRRKNFTSVEIFAFVGGLLGLFLGISVITFAEVVDVLLQPFFRNFSTKIRFLRQTNSFDCERNKIFELIDKLKSYVIFYLEESSVHSFNFMADAKYSIESIFWFLTFSVSMTGCTFMILQLYRTMDFKAVTLIIDDQLMDVSEIPFPAVTIFGRFPSYMKLFYPKLESVDEFDMTLWVADYEHTIESNLMKWGPNPISRC